MKKVDYKGFKRQIWTIAFDSAFFMEKFIDKDFLLENDFSKTLYHSYAEDLPIIDYHCHLDPKAIAEDKKWDNLAQLWLGNDHYKWTLMRTAGIDEAYITGSAPDYEKFEKFASIMPYALRNPMYHWVHMELSKFFGIDDVLLGPDTAREIWERANAVIKGGLSAVKCLEKSNVETICTTDDPTNDLEYNKIIAKSGIRTKVLPTFRPDRAFGIDHHESYVPYLNELEKASGVEIKSYDDLLTALKHRHDYFHEMGCRLSDYRMETVWHKNAFYYEVEDTFKKAISSSEKIAPDEILAFKSALLQECAAMDYDRGWVRQLHIGAMRDNNKKMFNLLGPDKGFDSMGESNFASALSKHLNKLNSAHKLPRTIICNVNPKDTALIASLTGNFQEGDAAGHIQLGSAWWFMDSLGGITAQIEAISSMSLLGKFVGMVTDSRSFLSHVRIDYFRRIFCNLLGSEMKRGILPKDINLSGSLVRGVCYENAKKYFQF